MEKKSIIEVLLKPRGGMNAPTVMARGLRREIECVVKYSPG